MVTGFELLRRSIAANPTDLAIITAHESWTFQTLGEHVDATAAALAGMGVEPGARVGVALDAGAAFVASVFAIWKIGAVFVPLPTSYPVARLQAMVEQARPAAIISTRAGLSWTSTATVAPATPNGTQVPPAVIDADAPAYLIFTSGSTGAPKGVLVAHRGLGDLVAGQAETFAIARGSRVLQFAALGFDAVISEIVVTLGVGGTLVIPSANQRMSLAELTSFMREQRVTVATFPPSILELLAPGRLPELATVVAAGEPCPLPVVHAWAPGRRFVNAYGPTETTVCATMAILPATCQRIVVGAPIRGTRVYLLDEQGREVVPGETGELVVAGPSVALGYWERPAETASAFIADPGVPGERAYRTGDLGRLVGDDIELLGRRDQQVKVAGYRIEPGDVEAALRALAGTERVLVFTVGTELAAALVGSPLDGHALELALRGRLPSFMVPSRWVLLDEWPLTPNGKVDRARLAALASPGEPIAAASSSGTLPQVVARVFASELQHEVDLDTDFFAAGGTSLKLLRLCAAIAKHTDVEVPIEAVLAGAVTARRLAKLVEERPSAAPGGHLAFHADAPGTPLVVVPPVTGDPLVFAHLAHAIPRPVYVLRPPGVADGETPIASFPALVEFLGGAAERLSAGRGLVIGGYSIGGLSAFAVAGELQARGVPVRALVLIDSPAPPPPEARTREAMFAVPNAATMFARMVATTVGMTSTIAAPDLASLSTDEVMERLRAELIRIGLAPHLVSHESVRRRFELFRTNLRTHLHFDSSRWTGPTVMVRSEEGHPFDKSVTLFDWSAHLTPVAQRSTPGNHFAILSAHHGTAAAAAVTSLLEELGV